MKRDYVARLLGMALAVTLASGCSWQRRLPLQSATFSGLVPRSATKVTVFIKPAVPGHPLPETVWDNVQGPFWSPAESEQIGFDQNYNARALIVPPAFWATAQTSGFPIVDSRLVVPFGRVFSETVRTGADQAFAEAQMCFSQECANSSGASIPKLTIAIEAFYVWESPENHLNLHAKVRSRWSGANQDEIGPDQVVERTMERENLGGLLSTHSGLIVAMNRAVNRFAQEVVMEMLRRAAEQAASNDRLTSRWTRPA